MSSDNAADHAERFIVVLNEPQNIVNIGGTARAMMNMGLRRLRLVRPAEYDEDRITGIAHGSQVVLERTGFFDSLRDAIRGAAHVVGTSARRRGARYVWRHPREAAPELLERAAEADGPVCIVFGREDAGLANEDLDLCDRVLTVPTDPEKSSLNLAQAVLLVAYELWLAGAGSERPLPRPNETPPPADTQALHTMFEDVHAALERIDFYKGRNPEATLRTLRALARRADLDAGEVRLLRATAIEVRKYIERNT